MSRNTILIDASTGSARDTAEPLVRACHKVFASTRGIGNKTPRMPMRCAISRSRWSSST
jgi:hypothetical protein